MIIEKKAVKNKCIRNISYFESARKAFDYFLSLVVENAEDQILLPAYIGWSPIEGSGVFDPILSQNLKFHFYKLDLQLHVNLEDLEIQLMRNKIKVAVIIHYFGHVDPNYLRIIELLRLYNCVIIEDEAHAFFTDLVDGRCGRLGDVAIYSLHKMLPENRGGALVFNNDEYVDSCKNKFHNMFDIVNYDLYDISHIRKRNTHLLLRELKRIQTVKFLWEEINENETLQTFPVLIEGYDRYKLYRLLNEKGFGVISLYHTLINEISVGDFPESHIISNKILNLPLHQDVEEAGIISLVDEIKKIIL